MSDATPQRFQSGDSHLTQPAAHKAEGWEAAFVRGMTDVNANLVSGGKQNSMFGAQAAEKFAQTAQTHLDTTQDDLYKSVYSKAA